MPGTRVSLVILAAAIVAGLTYLIADGQVNEDMMLVWKGLPVFLLSVYAARNAQNRDGWLIAMVMALGALGDVLIEIGLIPGALAFAAGHLVAIYLYSRHWRAETVVSQRMLGWMLVLFVPLISWQLTHDAGVAVYGLILGCMAAMAWTSAFPRYRVGLGAIFFVISDLLIFAEMGPLAGQAWVGPAIWLLYFGGQVMIATGVVRALALRAS
ncbi:MAG: lysoplasmalogenase [Sphingomonadales bacterium]|nr:lysoplasmalogenase [Sphingomonadales bacterium]